MNKEYHRNYSLEYYKRNKQDYLVRAVVRRKNSRVWVEKIKAKRGCEVCGERDPIVLDFHHKVPSQKDLELSKMRGYSKKRLLEEIEKCVVLCVNDHRREHAKNI